MRRCPTTATSTRSRWCTAGGSGRVADLPRLSTVDTLLRATHLSFPTRAELRTALGAYATGRGDFADYVIRERALAAGCTAVVTFDRALHGEPGFAAPA